MSMKVRVSGVVGFYSDGETKCVVQCANGELKNLGLHVFDFFAQADFASMEARAKYFMQHADPHADINSVIYTVPATDKEFIKNLLRYGEEEELDKYEFHESGKVVHTWQEMREYLNSDEPVTAYTVHKDFSAELYGCGVFRCQYAYILNLDARQLEIYERNNDDPSQVGRYAKATEEIFAKANEELQAEIDKWMKRGATRQEAEQVVPPIYGMRLILAIPLKVIKGMESDGRKAFVNLFHQLISEPTVRRDREVESICEKMNEKYPALKEAITEG